MNDHSEQLLSVEDLHVEFRTREGAALGQRGRVEHRQAHGLGIDALDEPGQDLARPALGAARG